MNWSEMLAVAPIVAVHGYALGTAAVLTGVLAQQDWLRRVALWILGVCFALHTVLLLGLAADGAFASLPVYLLMLAWGIVLMAFILWRMGRAALSAVLVPVALVVYLAGLLMRPLPIFTEISAMFSIVHIGSLFGATAMMALAFGAGCLFLWQERGIKSKTRLSPLHKQLPALSVLDRLNAVAVSVGFPLFTVGLLTGFVGARVAYGRLELSEPKELISLALWGLFAVLYHQRLARGWQGRKPAVLAIVIFVVCVFSLTVVNLFMTVHHGVPAQALRLTSSLWYV